MATIDLGKIKLVWRGTYNNGTAYTVDDVVEYTDGGILSSYVCVANSTGNAPSSGGTAHASWNYMTKGAVTGGFNSHQVFTSSGTWTKPTGVNKVKVTVTGGGGGGGGGNPNWNSRGGGGAGGTAIEVIDVSSVSSVTVTVGTAGSGGSSGSSDGGDGGNGGTSSFGSYCSATGGYGGTNGVDPASKTRGVGSGGDINLTGGDGTQYEGGMSQSDEGGSTDGGSSYWGGGGMGCTGDGVHVGGTGQAYGSGGGGGQHTTGNGSSAGGAGKAGIVYVEEFK